MSKLLTNILCFAFLIFMLFLISVNSGYTLPGQVMPAAVILICVMLFKNLEIKKEP